MKTIKLLLAEASQLRTSTLRRFPRPRPLAEKYIQTVFLV